MLDQVSFGDFSPHLHSAFLLESEHSGAVELRLVEAVPLGAPTSHRPAQLSQRAPFSLIFAAPSGSRLSQRIYKIRHAALGEFEIFLVPIGRDQDGMKLQAIFN